MANRYSTRICVICGNPFQVRLKADGTPRANEIKICSRVCRHDYEQKLKNPSHKKNKSTDFQEIESNGDLCGVSGCNKKHKTKGYCDNHYQRMRLNGTVKPKHEKVEKGCEWCGKQMTLTLYQSKKRSCCSRSCRNKLIAKRKGLRIVSEETFICQHCGTGFTAKSKNLYNGEAKYCSRECCSADKEVLRDIKIDISRQIAETRKLIQSECTALKRIKRSIEKHFATIECSHCGTVVSKKERIAYKYCSTSCHKEALRISKIANKSKPLSEKARAGKRAAKSRRRALMRNCENLERFDPFEIFDRDGWRCKCCGIKTPKKLRGTIKDNAPELDHIIPLSKGGDHSRQNTQLLCRKCNQDKSDGDASDQMLLFG